MVNKSDDGNAVLWKNTPTLLSRLSNKLLSVLMVSDEVPQSLLHLYTRQQ